MLENTVVVENGDSVFLVYRDIFPSVALAIASSYRKEHLRILDCLTWTKTFVPANMEELLELCKPDIHGSK